MEMKEFHWLLNIIQHMEVGVVVMDKENRIQIWNGFMESHSGQLGYQVKGQDLFAIFPEIDRVWFERKLNLVRTLHNPAFICWEQRAYLLKFANKRPITGSAPHMYQNITIMPLSSPGEAESYLAILIYDVTDQAVQPELAAPPQA